MRILGLTLLLSVSLFPAHLLANDSQPPTFSSICTSDVEGELKETCNEIRETQAALLLRNAKMENALAGITKVSGKEGTTTFSESSGTGKAGSYATILAVNAVTRAGHSMGQEICGRVPGANIYLGSPREFREASLEEQRFKRLYKMEQRRVARLKNEFVQLTRVMDSYIANRPTKEGLGIVEGDRGFGIKSVASASALATVLASSIENVSKLLRSDVTVTAYTVDIPDGTLEAAVKGGVIRAAASGNYCHIVSPDQILRYENPFQSAVNDLAWEVQGLRDAGDRLNLKISESILTYASSPTEFQTLLAYSQAHQEKTNAIILAAEGRERNLWNNVMSPLMVEGKKTGPSLLDRIITANSVQRDPNAVFVDVNVVESAAASVNSSGLFRTDRMHFQGNVVTRFEIISRNGHTLGSGFRDVALAELVRDRIGFKSHERTYEQPLQNGRPIQGPYAKNGLSQYEGVGR